MINFLQPFRDFRAYILNETVTVAHKVIVEAGKSIVKHDNKRYKFIAATDDYIDLSEEDYTATSRWEDVTDSTEDANVTHQSASASAALEGSIKIEATENATIDASATAASVAISASISSSLGKAFSPS